MPETKLLRTSIVDNSVDLRKSVAAMRANGQTIGVVPTMGALHDGHLSLVRASKAKCEKTIVTIFLNPTQFSPTEDLSSYPRTLERDIELLQKTGADIVFTPSNEEMYPPGFSTMVSPPVIANAMEGKHRPTHFQGVATIVLKLLELTQPDFAFFGQKDYQQSLVIRNMVRDLNVPVRIEVCPIVREKDGLAMSSRNAYLDDKEREIAKSLYRTLQSARESIEHGEYDARALMAELNQRLIDGGVTEIEYVVVADPNTLEILQSVDGPVAVLIAARVGTTRLIDNDLIP